VFCAALAAAAVQYDWYREADPALWVSPEHDRNAHYLIGLKAAADVRSGRAWDFVRDLGGERVWGPLHPALTAGVLLVGGFDHRLAVLPSLAGWVLAILFGFLSARRAAPRGGNLAGLTAALFIAASPAFRAYAVDVMLESLGAGLTLAALYFYLRAVQTRPDAVWPGRLLGLALTALFFYKYNYWMLTALALAGAALSAQLPAFWRALWGRVRGFDVWGLLRRERRRPWVYLLAAPAALVAAVALRGDRPFEWAGRRFSLYPPYTLLTIVYAVVFLRLALWWRREGFRASGRLNGALRGVARWHLVPAACWFLNPKAVGYFLWFVGPTNTDAGQKFNPAGGVADYLGWMQTDYHLGLGALLAAAVLFGCAVAGRLRPGGRAILWLALLSFALTVLHPNHKARNLHSWLPALWAGAGVGLAAFVHGRTAAAWPRLRPALAAAAALAVVLILAPAALAPGRAMEGGPHAEYPSQLAVTDWYLPQLDDAHRATVLCAVPMHTLAEWTFLERYGSLDRREDTRFGFADAEADDRRGFEQWLGATPTDAVVYLEPAPGGYAWGAPGEQENRMAKLRDTLYAQQSFRLVASRDFPELSCRATVWKRVAP
jgi:hypothetical protein